ncbi:hypothetical protein [Acinetobacter bereziniae]|nr:hypothetical protein [Acinetobacter bereziniae]
MSRKDKVSDVKLIHSTQINQIDTEVISAFMNAQITSDKKWWQIFKTTHQDYISFDPKDCN